VKQLFNLHTHTYRCQHASGDINDYCQVASELGLQSLGFSDHTPLPDNRWPNVRMKLADLADYCHKIDAAKNKFPQLTIYKALECEFDPSYKNFFQEVLLGKYKLDYLIGSVHWFPHNATWTNAWKTTGNAEMLLAYSRYIIQIMQSQIFDFIAHPDVFAAFYLEKDANSIACSRDILAAAAELKIPLEINGYGFKKHEVLTSKGLRKMYPWLPFWELASEYDIRVIANSDAHKPEHVYGCIDDAVAIAERYDLNLISDKELLNRV